MFGYCIWYKILDIHIINLIKELSILLNTCAFNPHLTILYKLKECDFKLLETYKKKNHQFSKYTVIYTKLVTINFMRFNKITWI